MTANPDTWAAVREALDEVPKPGRVYLRGTPEECAEYSRTLMQHGLPFQDWLRKDRADKWADKAFKATMRYSFGMTNMRGTFGNTDA